MCEKDSSEKDMEVASWRFCYERRKGPRQKQNKTETHEQNIDKS